MAAEGQFELAIRYYHKARTMKEADRCMALLEFESGNHHYAIDRLTELEEYALAFELAAKIQNKDKMAINKILSAKQNAKEIDDEYGGTFLMRLLATFQGNEKYRNLIYVNYLEEKIGLTEEKILQAVDALEIMAN